ncbi:MAG: TIGR03085 family protein [Actinobacteria bacterium]|nr:MAG: TIGR03085 family protein [Actinomycetota bacterium]
MPSTPAQAERQTLCDLFDEVGPDAPTLCGDWTTRDLAAHLVMRERRPDGAVGIVFSPAAGYSNRVQASIADVEWDQLVETVRSGPPIWSPTRFAAVDKLANTVEFFVHHEDVRRAGESWDKREISPELAEGLHSAVAKLAKQLTKRSDYGIVLEPNESLDPIVANKSTPSVTVRGSMGELVLFAYGRMEQADVELTGDDDAVEAVKNTSFGI